MQLQSRPISLALPQFPDFIPFSAVDRKTYESYINDFEPYSDYGYTSLYAWSRGQDHYVSSLNGNLVLSLQDYQSDNKIISFIGTNSVDDTATVLLDYVAQRDEYFNELTLIPETTASLISHDLLQTEEDIDNHDYILSTALFVDLPGPEFSHTRRKLSQFARHHGDSAHVIPLDLHAPQIQEGIRKLAYQWAFMGTEGSITAHEEILAIETLLKDIVKLNGNQNIHCLGMYVGGELEGFCIYEIQSDFAFVHFIKSNLELNGSADQMMVSTMRNIFHAHDIAKVNHEQDLGIEGLRAAKRRYNPTRYLKKYKVYKT